MDELMNLFMDCIEEMIDTKIAESKCDDESPAKDALWERRERIRMAMHRNLRSLIERK